MEIPFQNGAVIYEEGRLHKFGVNVMSWQINKYNLFEAPSYPLELLSEDKMVVFEAECKREGYTDNNLPGTNQPVPTGVGWKINIWEFLVCELTFDPWFKGITCVSGTNLGEQRTNVPREGEHIFIVIFVGSRPRAK